MKKVLIAVFCLFMISGCSVEKIKENERANNFSDEYNIREDHVFVDATVDDILDIFKKGTGIIYFGYPESKFCQEVVSTLDEISTENDIEEIYYLNVEKLKEDSPSDYQKIKEEVKDYLEYEDKDGNLMLYLPDVYFVRDGKIIGNHISTNKSHDELVNEQGNWVDLDDSEKSELKNIFLGLLTQLYSCDCNCK